jgi:hypothetical protein
MTSLVELIPLSRMGESPDSHHGDVWQPTKPRPSSLKRRT